MLRRFSVSILEDGSRLGLKCLLLSYFRIGDHPELPEKQYCSSGLNCSVVGRLSTRINVLIEVKEIGWIVPLLDLDETLVVRSENTFCSLRPA